jgi:uncharacterized protein (TIGR03437 family)
MTHKCVGPVASFRHRYGRILPQLSLFVVLTNTLCAANVPTFSYFQSGPVSVNVIASDSAANTYIAGAAQPGAIAATPGAFQSQDNSSGYCGVVPMVGALSPCIGSFIEKLGPTGAVIFATYFSGNGNTTISGIAVDQQGNIYVAGVTSPPFESGNTFPLTAGAAFTNPAASNLGILGSGAGFIAKLNPSGSQLMYSTLIPGTEITALAVDSEGNAYVTGVGAGSSFPATAGAFQMSAKASTNLSPGIVAKLNASGSALVYATYVSGSGGQVGEGDNPDSIAVDANGDAFVAGFTYSPDFPVTAGAFLTTNPGGRAMFLTKLNAQGSSLVYSTWIGQTNGYSQIVKLDALGTAFVAGTTLSGSGTVSGFLNRFSADGSALIFSTGLPSGFGSPALDVDTAGDAVIAVTTSDADLPVGAGAFQPGYVSGAASNVYVARFTPSGQLSGATYLGGSQQDAGSAIALRPNGSVVVSGFTQSPDFPGRLAQTGGSYTTSIFISLTALNAASYVATGIAPGEIVSLFGYGIGPATGVIAAGSVLPNELAGVQVSFGGLAAPLLYAQSDQINAQVPWELAGQTSATVQVSYPGVASTGTPVAVTPSLPGIFVIVNSDGSINSPTNPAQAGDYVSIYGTGGGAMSAPGITGALWPLAPLSLLPPPVSATVEGENADVLYAGSAPTLESGLFQINVRLPGNLLITRTAVGPFLSVTIGGVTSAPAAISMVPVPCIMCLE